MIEFAVAIFLITGDRMAGMQGVHACLMRAPGKQFDLNQRGNIELAARLEVCRGLLALFCRLHHAFAAALTAFEISGHSASLAKLVSHEREVVFTGLALA